MIWRGYCGISQLYCAGRQLASGKPPGSQLANAEANLFCGSMRPGNFMSHSS